MEVRFEGELTEQEYTRVYRKIALPRWSKAFVLFLLMMLIGFAVPVYRNRGSDNPFAYFEWGLFLGVVAVALLLVAADYFWGARVEWARIQAGERERATGVVGQGGIQWSTEEAATEYKWTAFKGYREIEGVLQLFFAEGRYTLLSRTCFASDGDWEAARALVREHVPTK